jgi:hypothetical protein
VYAIYLLTFGDSTHMFTVRILYLCSSLIFISLFLSIYQNKKKNIQKKTYLFSSSVDTDSLFLFFRFNVFIARSLFRIVFTFFCYLFLLLAHSHVCAYLFTLCKCFPLLPSFVFFRFHLFEPNIYE